jgi:hypothetical protein
LSRIQQVIDALEAERADLQERLAWLESQINEFRERHGDQRSAPAQRSVRRATARRASTRRATARQRRDDIRGRIIAYLKDHPQSTAGDVAKGLTPTGTRSPRDCRRWRRKAKSPRPPGATPPSSGVDPSGVVTSGRWGWLVVVILSGSRDLARGSIGQALVGSVVVAVDVGADLVAGLVEGLELLSPDAALLEL